MKISRRRAVAGLAGLALVRSLPAAAQEPRGPLAPLARPLARSEAARRRQEGRAADGLFLDQRAGRPAAVQDLRGRHRHQVQLHPRQRCLADLAHRDRDAGEAAVVRHRAHDQRPQDAAGIAGAVRSVGGEAHQRAGARPRPALVRRLHRLHDAGLQHEAGLEGRPADELRGFRQAQGVGRQGRDRPHRHRVAARHDAVLRRAEGHRAGARDRRQSATGADRRAARHGALGGGGRVSVRAQQFRQSHAEREARRRRDRILPARSGAALFRAGCGQRAARRTRTPRGSPPTSC